MSLSEEDVLPLMRRALLRLGNSGHKEELKSGDLLPSPSASMSFRDGLIRVAENSFGARLYLVPLDYASHTVRS